MGSEPRSAAKDVAFGNSSDVELKAISDAPPVRKSRRPIVRARPGEAFPASDAEDRPAFSRSPFLFMDYLYPTTMPSGPVSASTFVRLNPASFIHLRQSAPVKSKPP